MQQTAIVETLERRLLPRLEEGAVRLRRRYPRLRIRTWSSPVGSLTEYQGHDLGIDCLNPYAPPEETDNVALSIGVKQLTSDPFLSDASVCWGAGGPPQGAPAIHLDLLPEPVPWSLAALEVIEARLPELIECLDGQLDALDQL